MRNFPAQLAIGNSGSVWGMNSGGYTDRYVNGSFQYVTGALAQMAVGYDGDTWGTSSRSTTSTEAAGPR
jgi:hypothetical protein